MKLQNITIFLCLLLVSCFTDQIKVSGKGHEQLIFAAFTLNVDQVKELVEKGVDINKRMGRYDQYLFSCKSSRGYSHIGSSRWTPLLAVTNSLSAPGIDGISEKGFNNYKWDCKKVTPEEQIKRERKRVEIIKILLDSGADINVDDGYGATPLYSAINENRTLQNDKSALFLISAGAKVNTTVRGYIDGCGGRTPLHKAAVWWQTRVVKALLKAGADPNVKDGTGMTPLDDAYLCKAPDELIKALLDYGAKPNKYTKKSNIIFPHEE